ncbi:class I SAM-dependent methyltransferase [soil metagenome]
MPAVARAVVTSAPYEFVARRVLLPWALQGHQPSGEGLEIGAGGGSMTARLLTEYPRLRMVATDYDPEMVGAAGRSLARLGDRVSVEQADAGSLPFTAGRFDFVLSAAMLHHVVAWERALAEAVRVLRPGGRLIGYDVQDTAPVRWMHATEHDADVRMLRAGQLEAELARLGVTDVRVRTGVLGLVMRFDAGMPT